MIRLALASGYVATLTRYAWKDWYKSLCGLVLLMARSSSARCRIVLHHNQVISLPRDRRRTAPARTAPVVGLRAGQPPTLGSAPVDDELVGVGARGQRKELVVIRVKPAWHD